MVRVEHDNRLMAVDGSGHLPLVPPDPERVDPGCVTKLPSGVGGVDPVDTETGRPLVDQGLIANVAKAVRVEVDAISGHGLDLLRDRT